jgi:hypothetical protein
MYGAYLFVLITVLFAITLWITHSVAGAALILRRAIDRMSEGDLDGRWKLRKGDYLQKLAASIRHLRDVLEAESRRRERLCREIKQCLDRWDVEGARVRATELEPPAVGEPIEIAMPEKFAA